MHEAARYSDVHRRWFFFPRKLSRRPYDAKADESKCCNLFISAVETSTTSAGESGFDPSTILAAPRLSFNKLRGCSDFVFIPGTNDTHVLVARTEERAYGDVRTFVSVMDLEGSILMEERAVADGRKFEGVALLPF